jgi:transcription termination/antitermination protein NusA
MNTTYTGETLQYMRLFEKLTGAQLKDCFVSREKLVFLVDEGQMGRALGKNKMNIVKLEKAVNTRFKVVEFSSDMLQFIQNMMAPLRIVEMKEEDGIVTITGPDEKTKGLMIGARAQNLRAYEDVIKKYYPNLKEIKVI